MKTPTMSEIKGFSSGRRLALQRLAAATGAALAAPAMVHAATVAQTATSGTAQKSAVQYQDHPMGESACANCANFIPGRTPEETGHCIIVAGDISPRGWCVAYVNGS